MKENEKLNRIKELAKEFLNLPIESCGDISPLLVVHHPFFTSCMIYDNNNGNFFNAIEDNESFQRYLEYFKKEVIDKCTTVEDVIMYMNKTYIATFLKFAEDYRILSTKECGNIYGLYWNSIEFPSRDCNVTIRHLVKWMSKADKEYIMSDDDFNDYNMLDEEIIVYRGVQEQKYKNGMSWTIDLKTAKFFANRFKTGNDVGHIYKGKVNKSDVLAFFCGEDEVVVDYKNVKNIKKVIL